MKQGKTMEELGKNYSGRELLERISLLIRDKFSFTRTMTDTHN